MGPVPRQRGPGPGSAEPESFPLLRRRLPLCGLRAAALELDWLWLNGQGQVLSKHQAHWAAGPSPLASVKSFPGRVGCSPGQSSSGKEGGAFPGFRVLAGGREQRGTSSCPTFLQNNLFPLTFLPASIKNNPKTGSGGPSHLWILFSCLLVDPRQVPYPLWVSISLSLSRLGGSPPLSQHHRDPVIWDD